MRTLVTDVVRRALALGIATLAGCGVFGDNHPPKMEPIVMSTQEDKAAAMTFVATDEDGDDLELSVDSVPLVADLAILRVAETHPDGTTRLETECRLRTSNDFHGEVSFTVHVTDGTDTTDAFNVVTFEPENDFPVGVDDWIAARVNAPAVIAHSTLLANDYDTDDEEDIRMPLSIASADSPFHGALAFGTDTITFAPEADFTGLARFIYLVDDGEITNPVTVWLNVGGANDAPIAVEDHEGTYESAPLVIATRELTENDIDAEHESLAVTAVANPTHGTVQLIDDTITFTRDPGFIGMAGFDYTITDGVDVATGHVEVTIAPLR